LFIGIFLYRYEFVLVNEAEIKQFGIVPAQMNLLINNVIIIHIFEFYNKSNNIKRSDSNTFCNLMQEADMTIFGLVPFMGNTKGLTFLCQSL